VDGRNVSVEYRWADGDYNRLPVLAAELVQLRPAVILANGPAAQHAKAASPTIPVVFTAGFNPVELGLVSSLEQPAGNLTGISMMHVELGPKRLELVHELVPGADPIAVLLNPTHTNLRSQVREMQAAAQSLGLHIQVLHANTDDDLMGAFATLRQLRAGALLIGADPFFTNRSRQLAIMALSQGLPAAYQYRGFVASGGLMSYGSSLASAYREAGVYVGRILKGDKPADLPIQQSTKIDLMVNLTTASALGLSVPQSLLARADEIIE
jgi:putative ABC transport system substrate-binding protein